MIVPAPPTLHAVFVLALTALALFLFTRQRIALESSSLSVLVALTLGFELFPYQHDGETLRAVEFFSGFGHEALVAVCALMIAGQGLVRTGALEPVGRALARIWSHSPALSLLLTLVIGAVLSAFVNNTPIVVLLLPILIGVSLRTKTSASAVLMPMGFATLVGGMSTTIGTSTNLLVVAVAADLGLPRLEMFDFFLPAAIAGGVGLLYLWLIAPRLLPEREVRLADTSPRVFTAELQIPEDSFADKKPLSEVVQKTDGAMYVSRIRRGPNAFAVATPDTRISAGDRLVVRDTPEQLKEFEQVLGAALYSGDTPVDEEHPLTAEDQQIAEVVVTGAPLEGSTLNDLRFTDRYQLVTLALHRAGRTAETLRRALGDVVLRAGDVLLVQGPREQVVSIKHSGELLMLDATADLPHTAKAPLAAAIMMAVVLLAAFGVLPIAVSAVCGALVMIATGCLGWRDATSALSVPVILIVVTSLALGAALTQTGAAEYLARLFVLVTLDAPAPIVLSALMLLMAVITNIVSNNAAAVIGTPIAIAIAGELGAAPEAFVLAVLFGANMSYATPMAYKTNLLVMNAGGYRFIDFVIVGVPLTLIMWITLSWLLSLMYGF